MLAKNQQVERKEWAKNVVRTRKKKIECREEESKQRVIAVKMRDKRQYTLWLEQRNSDRAVCQ